MNCRLILCPVGMRASGRSGRVLIAFCRANPCGDCQCNRGSLPARGSSGSRLCHRLLAGGPVFLDLPTGGWRGRNLPCRRRLWCSRIRLPGGGVLLVSFLGWSSFRLLSFLAFAALFVSVLMALAFP